MQRGMKHLPHSERTAVLHGEGTRVGYEHEREGDEARGGLHCAFLDAMSLSWKLAATETSVHLFIPPTIPQRYCKRHQFLTKFAMEKIKDSRDCPRHESETMLNEARSTQRRRERVRHSEKTGSRWLEEGTDAMPGRPSLHARPS